ncbi:uncharacterized protein LOC111060565 [Nilaparvata lugens]|uniref:uncharacterized protein LOC111060565 n=1 Tax=Nilaparvata lugens TaxID=108931 RepID=UPI00193D0190|nr:uncharacterized protein LOC111060565 [Nilaparvata lugens]XP_039295141.1 uncharacterized protein LOC111060565 [Nilaparvata lugens]XP_039295142.1 uncharacterized protein LOC111060565 [Nilaparvata lugens]XP_039295143.1 uncharacterized protein LOC111060565 [Nilaparvata lugens]XP_039295144.1 uncharacterized protein LOC111060565 [Nilaparvata lugens]XP_039295146.1 uncharacterized protein LOC111060565 [Nilaparvata lugens]XP_039295147.1 uncharacterized protein LOC111060565 [Nilaparvata lugens]XP_0
MDISTSVRDWLDLFTHESVMNALVRDILSSSSTKSSSSSSVADKRLTCLIFNDSISGSVRNEKLKQIIESMRDTYSDASHRSGTGDSNHSSLLINQDSSTPKSLLPNNSGAGDEVETTDVKCLKQDSSTPKCLLPNNSGAGDEVETTDVKCLKSECDDCQITSYGSIWASKLDIIQSSRKSTTNTSDRPQSGDVFLSNGLIKLVQALKDTTITSLNLSRNGIDCDLLIDLAQYLPSTQIKSLDLSKNSIGLKGYDYLVNIVGETQISSLNMTRNSFLKVVTDRKYSEENESFIDEEYDEPIHCNGECNSTDRDLDETVEEATRSVINMLDSKSIDPSCVLPLLKNSKVELLDLSFSRINPKSFASFAPYLLDSSLTILDLSDNELGNDGVKILASVLKNTKIRSLNLSANHINCDGLKVFAPCLVDSQITSLNLSRNRFDFNGMNSLALVLPNTKITILDLSSSCFGERCFEMLSACLVHTKITLLSFAGSLPRDYNEIESLAVGIKESQISGIDVGYKFTSPALCSTAIAQLLSICVLSSHLTSITLSHCRMNCSVMEDLVIAVENSYITSIKFINISMTCEVIKIFVSCVVNSKITHLRLSNRPILDIGAVECLALALKNTQISWLDLSNNGLDCKSLMVLAPCLADTKLEYLNLENNKIDQIMEEMMVSDYDEEYDSDDGIDYRSNLETNDVGVKSLSLALKNSQITNLNLGHNYLTCKSLMNLILSLPDTKITTLNLSGNELCCNLFYLADILKNTQISSLDLGNHINNVNVLKKFEKSSDDASLDLSEMRCSFFFYYFSSVDPWQTIFKNITSLNLSQNQISCCGELKTLCQCLSGSRIVSLDLSDNRINCDCVYYLARILQYTQISSLNLANNKISTNGVKHMAHQLPKSQLTKIDLSHNLITDDSIEYLSRNLVNASIADLNLSGNQIGRQSLYKLCEGVAEINVQFDFIKDDSFHHFNLCKYPGCIIEIYQATHVTGIDHVIDYVCDKAEITKVYIHAFGGVVYFKSDDGTYTPRKDTCDYRFDIDINEIELIKDSMFPLYAFKNITKLKLNGTQFNFMNHLKSLENGEKIIELRIENIPNMSLDKLGDFRLSNIMYLDLSNNNLGDVKFECLAEALKYNCMNQSDNDYMISLDLSNNKLGARSAQVLSQVLPFIPKLAYIDLHGNNIGHSGFQSLMKVVDRTNLCWLSLGDNNIEDQLQEDVELSPYIVPRKGAEIPVAFQVRYLFRQLVSLDTSSGELEFTIPTTVSNPPVNITHYPKLLKIYSEFEKDVKYFNVHVYDNYYLSSKKHDRRLLEKIEKFGNEIENRFLSFIDRNVLKFQQIYGRDSFVVLVKECERLELNKCVESLLIHRVMYYVDDDKEILHPFVYRMMHKYSIPLYCEQIEPNKRQQIIAYYQNHQEIEEAETLIDLLASMST